MQIAYYARVFGKVGILLQSELWPLWGHGILMYSVCLVMCSKDKRKVSARAKHVYISDRFKAVSSYAQSNFDRWYVLSAKHGLVEPDSIISPYDMELSCMAEGARREWGRRVVRSLFMKRFPSSIYIQICADPNYEEPLSRPLRARGFRPLLNLSNGRILEVGETVDWPCSTSWLKGSGVSEGN